MTPSPFSLAPDAPGLVGRLASLALEPLLGLSTLDRLYEGLPPGNFIDRALERLGIQVDVSAADLLHVPETGPVIVVANHPTGAMDGLALAHAIGRRRPDVRILGNKLLTRIPEMRDWTIAVDPFDRRSPDNRRGLRAATAWLRSGGVLVVFPAGAVSHTGIGGRGVSDEPWHHGVLRLASWSGCAVVPAFVDARPSRLLGLAGLVHPALRTMLLPRELLRLRNKRIGVRLSAVVGANRLAAIAGAEARLAYLRARTYALADGRSGAAPVLGARSPIEAVAPPVDQAALERDIAALPPEAALLSAGPYSVYCAGARALPAVLLEIGRLRELTFRAAGEGTGRATDLDRFDATYRHLFVWHRERGELVGAYRVGATDVVCGRDGVAGLYSHTLFRLSPALLASLGPALELGRSFVRAEYQRESSALLLLWRGIGALVAREPKYRRLFGPVSISAEYSAVSRGLMLAFLSAAGADRDRSALVRPRHPVRPHPDAAALLRATGLARLEEVDAFVRDFEGGRGVPVLLRQYWKLNARLLGFSVDPAFGHTLDGLMVVDFATVSDTVRARYIGAAARGRG